MKNTTKSDGPDQSPAVVPVRAGSNLKKSLTFGLLILSVVGGAVLGYHWFTSGRFIEFTDDAYVGGDVTVIAPKVAGFVAEIDMIDNQAVHQGDLLIRLDDRDFRAAYQKAQAQVSLEGATETNLDAQAESQAALVVQARAEVAAADAEIARTKNDFVRFKTLVATGAESAQTFDRADAAYKVAKANGDKYRAAYVAAERQLDVIATQKMQTQAALKSSVADLELAKLNLSYTELRAPMDGVVGNRSAQVGSYATVGSQLVSLVPARGLWIDANFKEDQMARIHAGSPATVQFDLFGGKYYKGRVVSIAPATGSQFSILPPENATGNFTKIVQRVAVRIQLDDEKSTLGQLRPGLSATVRVYTQS